MNVEEVPYGGWQKCLRIANAEIEAIITTEVGPRIIRFGFINDRNELAEYPDQIGRSGGAQYRSYGGHRLWIAPESKERTYYPDNHTVEWWAEGEGLHCRAPVESSTQFQKELELWIDPHLNTLQVIHRVKNCSDRPAAVAAWAISVMAPGGSAIVPQEPFRPHPEVLLPVRPLILWSYTQMDDPRWRWGSRYIQLHQNRNADQPQKLGIFNKQGWIGYANDGHLFVKSVAVIDGATYPDFGSNCEIFTNKRMLEMETLSPLIMLQPDETVRHDEHWSLFRGITIGNSDDSIDTVHRTILASVRNV